MADPPKNGNEKNGAWGIFLRSILERLLSPHFIIAVIIIWIWHLAISIPIGSIQALSAKMVESDAKGVAEMQETASTIRESVVIISSVFTTVLALVLGYFFGQTGEAIRTGAKEQKELEAKQSLIAAHIARHEQRQAELLKIQKDLEAI